MATTRVEKCGQCRGEDEDCDLCAGTGQVRRCCACGAAINPEDGEDICFYCDTMGEDP